MDRFIPRVFNFGSVGFATDLPSQARELTHWLKAENCLFEVSGKVRKVGGASKINSTVVESGADILGMFDFWRGGGAASFTQKFVIVSNQKVLKEDMDGAFDDITGAASITANVVPIFCQARDLLTIWTSANDTALKWNMTGNVASLGGTPPVGRGMVFHVNRGWVWGVNANPSRLYYSSSTDIEDWSGADTGSIDIEPEDGDRIIGAVSFKQILFVFKGPNKGSIHMIGGTSPTGADGFSRKVMVRGIPLQTHNSIVSSGNDIFFQSDKGIHSLSATEQFGNFSEANVTRFLRTFFSEQINQTQLHKVWGVDYREKGCLLWVMPGIGNTENNLTFGLSYARLKEEGWKPFTWTRSGISMAIRKNPTTYVNQVAFGGTDGFCRLQDVSARNIDGTTAYNLRLLSPEIIIGQADQQGKPRADQPVVLERLHTRATETGGWNINIALKRDGNISDNYTINQGLAGFLLGTSVLGTGILGGERTQVRYSNPSVLGEARTVQFDFIQGGLNEDADLLEFGVEYSPIAQTDAESLVG